jgi:ribonuclease HI
LGVGVVCHTGQHEYTYPYKLGRWTGSSGDAEVFAIAAALGLAQKGVEEGRTYKLVRVYSDTVGILQKIETGKVNELGPLVDKKTALQALYERAQWLKEKGVNIELIWVKGHMNSRANKIADRTAARAVEEAADDLHHSLATGNGMSRDDVPAWCMQMGRDWVEEWLFRANRNPYRHKRRPFYHAPTASGMPDYPPDKVGAIPASSGLSQRKRPTFILKWKNPPEPAQKHTFREPWGTNSEESGEDMKTPARMRTRSWARHHGHTPYHESVMSL